MKIPEKLNLANLPTRIEKLERFTEFLGGPEIWIKRDDQTGTELSGNKVRKLEFAMMEAKSWGSDWVITCGGIQSNHARATAVSAAMLGFGCSLVLVGDESMKPEGNHLMDCIFGAEIHYVSGKDYTENRHRIMLEIGKKLAERGHKAYLIPEGASNGIGAFGYLNGMEEIYLQEKERGIDFHVIASATGSGGTYTGLFVGDQLLRWANPSAYARNAEKRHLGFAVGKNKEFFENEIEKITEGMGDYITVPSNLDFSKVEIFQDYIGRGYALSTPEEIQFIKEFAQMEGILLDPVYTGKAMFGLMQEIRKGTITKDERVLFIHTGGLFGLLGKSGDFLGEV